MTDIGFAVRYPVMKIAKRYPKTINGAQIGDLKWPWIA